MESPHPNSTPPERASVWFQLAGALAALFVITVFAMIAAMFGDPNAPSAQFFDRHGVRLIAGEVIALVVAGLIAMVADLRRSLRQKAGHRDAEASPTRD